ncbi:SMP-30/gluconolactonase/LRE family protein [Ferrovibrio sp.]|uniref:SMP-30/gluconolactonase/LRE family protein n=1 Tax=Ferrovibrio sp. TaxID=1917215 RepID=UPI0025B9363D|nr:SMP-30/gluconolactonase/LRE family protein [Ferrovibrio sp.]MBX3454180.1 SMP-30/gluconolactonase/LRE family protein [Ferrovibrio sp.]
MDFKKCISFELNLGESPVWDVARNRLWFVDILAPSIHLLDPATGDVQTFRMPADVGSVGLAKGGRLVVALRTGVHLFDPASEKLEFLVHPEPDLSMNRLNDGKVGPDGCFWVGSMHDAVPRAPTGGLYRVTPSGECTRVVEGMRASNGLAWSPDGKVMYHADSRAPDIRAYDFDRVSGRISGMRTIATPSEEVGLPDGAAVDIDGNYWSAGITSGHLNKFSPDGVLTEAIELPMAAPTMPCFGGQDMKTMYITSLTRAGGDEKFRGTLISWETDTVGVTVGEFG